MIKLLNYLSLRNKILATNISLLLAAVLIISFITWPSFSDIKNIKADIHAQRTDLEEKYKRSLGIKKLTENLKIIEPQIEKLDQVFISQNRELEFITALENVAAQKNVTQKINLGKAQSSGDKIYKKLPLDLQAQGGFRAIMSYLEGLEALTYYVNIKNITMSAGGIQSPNAVNGGYESGGVTVNINADTYWR